MADQKMRSEDDSEQENSLYQCELDQIMQTLAEIRMDQNLSQSEFSERCGIKQSNLSRLESGKGNPTIKTIEQIAKGLNIKISAQFNRK
ncbi:MAG: helix-turn-helix domain-containing protein [Eggerthellaceae bacterium]|nr:helix-turn-helix domain-containing protein [Eggerthellaceae bacterium]MCH4220398.1 helix-turn-helix domain-containing protein [Eggerthellaceae bacterium]